MSRLAFFSLGAFFGGSGTLAIFEWTKGFGGGSMGSRHSSSSHPPRTGVPLPSSIPSNSNSMQQQSAGSSSAFQPGTAVVGNPGMFRYGLPSDGNIRVFSEYVASLNYERRIPNWVMEYFSASGGSGGAAPTSPTSPSSPREGSFGGEGEKKVDRSRSQFYSDPTVPDPFRASNPDYSKGGYSRGHLAAAQFHKTSQGALDETFNLSTNVVPQDMSVNGCDWYRLEDMVKKIWKQHKKDSSMWVVTGPAFVPKTIIYPTGAKTSADATGFSQEMRYGLIGQHAVAVPTHLFKVILLESLVTGKKSMAAFLMQNTPIPEERPLTAFQIPVAELERLTGLQFFPSLLHPEQQSQLQQPQGNSMSVGMSLIPRSSNIADLCRESSEGGCVGSYGSFSNKYRQEARLRSANSLAELQSVWNSVDQSDESLRKQYEKVQARLLNSSAPAPGRA